MSTASKSAVNISTPNVYTDGSGAPCTVECAGYVFCCDWLNGYRATLIRPVSGGTRTQNRIAAECVERAYTAWINVNTSAEWRAANAAMYAEE